MKTEKVEKPVTNFHDKNKYVIYIRNLKKALNQQLILKKVHVGLNLIKTLIDMNTKLR